jgi:hypothetical protein
MARDKLTAKQVEKFKKPGIYGDGGNLYLRVSPGGKRWVLIYRNPSSGKRTEMGLGGFANVALARAREKAAAARELLAQGVNDAARVRKLRSGENPAAWRNNLKLVMPKQPKAKRRHAAMPFGDVPAAGLHESPSGPQDIRASRINSAT